MRLFFRTFVAINLCCATNSWAESAVKDLAELTGTNIGLVSAKLSDHQKGVNAHSLERIARIASIEGMSTESELYIDREVAILNQTGGKKITKLFDALRAHAAQAASVPGKIRAEQEHATNNILAGYTPLAFSTDKLDKAAKLLATLGKDMSTKEQADFIISYFTDVNDEVKKLKEASQKKAKDGDKKENDVGTEIEKSKLVIPGSTATTQ